VRWRGWATAGVLAVVVGGGTGAVIVALPASGSVSSAVTVTDTSCASQWGTASTAAGTRTLTITSGATVPGEVNLDNSSGGVEAEVESLAPGASVQMTISLSSGTYQFACYLTGMSVTHSPSLTLVGSSGPGPIAVLPVTLGQLAGPDEKYQAYAAGELSALAAKVTQIQADLSNGDLATARSDWLQAQLDWELVGASYDSFGPLGQTVDGLPNGLPGGVSDPSFTGLHRLEYGLWHGESASSLLTVATRLAANVSRVRANLTSPALAGNAANLPVRAHEILEDALRDHLSLMDDEGGGAGYAETYADAQVTRVVLNELAPLIDTRAPSLLATASTQLTALQNALSATQVSFQWQPPSAATREQRETIDADTGAVLETLAIVPDILEVRSGS
jgi:high-affinity iron transporter